MSTKWQIGDNIQNRWQIHEILGGPGHSGMGIVYVVYDHELHEVFAIKTFQEQYFPNEAARMQFLQEALLWIHLEQHPNITQARFAETIQGLPFLFLEYVSGGNLAHWIGTPRLLEDLPQTLLFAIQFCDGMNHALSKGITAHRDIKPQNCLITEQNVLKITDFGLAKVRDEMNLMISQAAGNSELRLEASRTGVAAGTCTHMAPEQFDDAKHVDVRADIYSFGVMLFQMINGQLPFVGRTIREFEILHKRQSPPKLNTRYVELTTIVQTCLAKDPAQRFQDFSGLRLQLAKLCTKITGKPVQEPEQGTRLDVIGWNNKGLGLYNLGQHREALVCYDHALQADDHYAPAWVNKGNTLDDLGKPQEAMACYERAIRLNPDDGISWSNKGTTLRKLGKTDEALRCYDRCIKIDPRYPPVWYNRGNLLESLSRHKEAQVCFDQALKLNPYFDSAWTSKGASLVALGRVNEAMACYDRALELNPRDATAWSNKAAVFSNSGRTAEAITCCDQALALNARDAEAWSNKGTALYAEGRLTEALSCFDHALEIKPDYVDAWSNRGGALAGLGQPAQALKCFERALQLNPSLGAVWFNKGAILINDFHRYQDAIVCFEKARQLGYQPAAQIIGQLRAAYGKK